MLDLHVRAQAVQCNRRPHQSKPLKVLKAPSSLQGSHEVKHTVIVTGADPLHPHLKIQ